MDFNIDIGRIHIVKRIGLSLIISALCLSVAAPAAMAASASLPAGKRAFTQLDGNQDGKLTVEELSPRATKRLERYDGDRDGTVSKAEIDAVLLKMMEQRRDRLLRDLDSDHDDVISSTELLAVVKMEFIDADRNGDGVLTPEEAQTYRPERKDAGDRKDEEESGEENQ
jgi:Ca2+-binding EF-hand superfamily protein